MSLNHQVIFDVKNHIGLIKLNRLNALNAFSLEMIESITETLKKWKNDSDVYMIYISSNHHQSFCAGGDVKSLYEHSMNHDHKYPEIYLSKQYTMDYIIQTYQKPILTYIDGYVFGGGVGFSIGSSHLVVSERVKFAMPETKIGFFPDVGASYFLNRLPYHVGKYIGILGPILNESDLLYLNIADYVIKHDAWNEVEEALFNLDFRKDFVKADLNRLLGQYHQHIETSKIKNNIQSIDYIFSEKTLIDMIKKLDINHPFEKELQQRFLEMSATAMTFTLEMLLRTKSLTLLECLKFEQRLSENVIKTHDFKEGVRSLLVDKDQRFDYKPKTVSDVNKNDIEKLFNFDMSQPHMMDELLKDYEK
jgi:enoyl-CoA hydratase/carnithine racemase